MDITIKINLDNAAFEKNGLDIELGRIRSNRHDPNTRLRTL